MLSLVQSQTQKSVFKSCIVGMGLLLTSPPSLAEQTDTAPIILQKIILSEKVRQKISQRVRSKLQTSSEPSSLSTALPSSLQLGMNNLPVLTQGEHGTCVTFAVTAAIDATLSQGQYSSQLCLLQLGHHLERMNGEPSGWDGTSIDDVLRRIKNYGIINITDQQQYGCGGIQTYPEKESTPSSEMTLKNYLQHSTMLPETQITWSTLWSSFDLFSTPTDETVIRTKEAIHKGQRVIVSAVLPRIYTNRTGAVGTYHQTKDTWVLTPAVGVNFVTIKEHRGHAMIVTGYDDRACATDQSGEKHCGLFTLRNSWGPNVGDGGDFYMSYDYFDLFVLDAVQIGIAHRS